MAKLLERNEIKMTTFNFTIKQLNGGKRGYPDDEPSFRLVRLLKQTTINLEQIEELHALGFEIYVTSEIP